MTRAVQHRFDELIIFRRDFSPGRPAVAFIFGVCRLILLLQKAAFAVPGVRQAVDNDELKPFLLGRMNRFDVFLWRIRRMQRQHAVCAEIGIQIGAAVFRIDDGDLFYRHDAAGNEQGRIGFAGPRRAGQGQAEFCHLADGFLKDSHSITSMPRHRDTTADPAPRRHGRNRPYVRDES